MCLKEIPQVGTSKDIGSVGYTLEYINPFSFKSGEGYPSSFLFHYPYPGLGLITTSKMFSSMLCDPSRRQWKYFRQSVEIMSLLTEMAPLKKYWYRFKANKEA